MAFYSQLALQRAHSDVEELEPSYIASDNVKEHDHHGKELLNETESSLVHGVMCFCS